MDPAGARDMELAWQLLTLLIRLGHPAAASELAAAAAEAAVAVSPQLVERLCSIPGSPLRFSGGVVTASETAILAFQRFAGWDFPASWKGSEERTRRCGELAIRYERKRKASDDARRGFGVKRHLLMESDADLVEHKQQQLAVQSCFPVPTADVRLEDMQDTLGTCIAEPSKSPNGVTLVPKNIHAAADNESSRIGEPEGALSLDDCRVEDSDDQEKESILPAAVEAALVGDTKVGIEENIHAAADNDISRIAEPEGAFPLYNCRVEDNDDQERESIRPMAVEAEPEIELEEEEEEEEERAQSTSSSLAIRPSPEHARIAMNKFYAQLDEDRRLRQEDLRRKEEAFRERMAGMAAERDYMYEMIKGLYVAIGQTPPPLIIFPRQHAPHIPLMLYPSAGSNEPGDGCSQASPSNPRSAPP